MLALVPVLKSSAEQPKLDEPINEDSIWSDACTETFYGNRTPPFKTVIHSRPQRVWNGTAWKEYEITSINESSVILQTPTCTYLMSRTEALLFRPSDLRLPVAAFNWVIEKYPVELSNWAEERIDFSNVGFNATHVWQLTALSDGGTCTSFISTANKQTVALTSGTCGKYRVSWRLSNIEASRAVLSSGLLLNLTPGAVEKFERFDFEKLSFWSGDAHALRLDYSDVAEELYQECELGCSDSGFGYVCLAFGDWPLLAEESIVLDPSSDTFSSEASLDGTITKYGYSYPPSTAVVDTMSELVVGQEHPSDYFTYRGYVSFDTSSIQDNAQVTGAVLKLKTFVDASDVDFTMRVIGGSQPIYGDALTVEDWNCSCTEIATLASSNCAGAEIYENITISPTQVNKVGRTQFELRSDREGYPPQSREYVVFYSGDSYEKEPILEITWLPYKVKSGGFEWYYWNSSTNTNAIIILFGGWGLAWSFIVSEPLYASQHDQCRERYIEFIEGLLVNGFNVLTPAQPLWYGTGFQYQEIYNASIHNAAGWLRDQGCENVFLFGHSAGGVIVSWEILADYAGNYSAAIMCSAPVYSSLAVRILGSINRP
jgi:hypothetical protein